MERDKNDKKQDGGTDEAYRGSMKQRFEDRGAISVITAWPSDKPDAGVASPQKRILSHNRHLWLAHLAQISHSLALELLGNSTRKLPSHSGYRGKGS